MEKRGKTDEINFNSVFCLAQYSHVVITRKILNKIFYLFFHTKSLKSSVHLMGFPGGTESESHSVVPNSLRPHGLYSP